MTFPGIRDAGHRLAVAALLAACAAAAAGQEIGTITGAETTSWLDRGAGWVEAERTMHIAVGNSLRTQTGRLAVLVFDEFRPDQRQVFVLAPAAELSVIGQMLRGTRAFALRARLAHGEVRWLGPGEILAPPLGAYAKHTEFIVRRHDSGVAEVVVLDGVVQVWNLDLDRAPIAVGAGQRSRVEPGWPPSEPQTLSAAELQQQVLPFLFVGGGVPEGQAANHPLLTGEGVPPPDRAAVRDPAHAPDEDDRRKRAEEPPIDQPGPVVTSPELGIEF